MPRPTTHFRARPHVVRVELVGEFDISTARQLREQLLDDHSAPVVAADMSGVRFLDASAIRVLLEVDDRLTADGRRLALVDCPLVVRRILSVLDLTDRFPIIDLVDLRESNSADC